MRSSCPASCAVNAMRFPPTSLSSSHISSVGRGTFQLVLMMLLLFRHYGLQENKDATGSIPSLGQENKDATGSTPSLGEQVFVKPLYGTTLSLQVDMEKDVQLFKEEVQQRIQIDVSQNIFVYGLQTLEAGNSLSSYGVKKDCTISLISRCRGGKRHETLLQFYIEHENEMLRTVHLPDGFTTVELTEMGCILLASLVQLFTSVFVRGKTWNGRFNLGSFKVNCGRVMIKLQPLDGLTSSSIQQDCVGLSAMIIAMFVKDNIYPPYLKHLLQKLDTLAVDVFTVELQLAYNNHLSLILSLNRVNLVYLIKRSYDGWCEYERQRFRDIVNNCSTPDYLLSALKDVPLFHDVIVEGLKRRSIRMIDGYGAFVLVRNYNTHASKHSWMELLVQNKLENYQWCKCDNGLELMVPKYLGDFLADAVHSVIEEKFDIKDALLTCSGAVFNTDSALVTSSSSSSSSSESSSDSSSDSQRKRKTRRSNSKKRKNSSRKRKRRHSSNSKKRKRIDFSISSRKRKRRH